MAFTDLHEIESMFSVLSGQTTHLATDGGYHVCRSAESREAANERQRRWRAKKRLERAAKPRAPRPRQSPEERRAARRAATAKWREKQRDARAASAKWQAKQKAADPDASDTARLRARWALNKAKSREKQRAADPRAAREQQRVASAARRARERTRREAELRSRVAEGARDAGVVHGAR